MARTFQFKSILIIGVGLIGGSLALALKRKGYDGRILGIDEEDVLERARSRGALDQSFPRSRLTEAVAGAELIFLCTPILEILKLLQEISGHLRPGTLVTDVGSTKRRIVEAATLHLPSDCDFIGGHPMAGSEFRGIDAADPFLFENTTYVLTPVRPIGEKVRMEFGELLELTGAKVLLLLPALHDEIAAAVSHLPQMASVALMNLVAGKRDESPHFIKMAAGGFRDMTRIASSPYSVWEDIHQTNADMITLYIDAYISELEKVKSKLRKPELESYFQRSAANRLSIPKDTKGFLRPQFDISVSVEDRPGIIASIAGALAERNINIKDIEILKIREDEGGTLRLAFASDRDRESALGLLRDLGMECRRRD